MIVAGTAGHWVLAAFPVVLLVVLVLSNRLRTGTVAVTTVVVTALIATLEFGAGSGVLTVAAGKGVWTGIWILYVIWPALLLYHLCARVGMDRVGPTLSRVLARDVENVLVVAWVFPSFVQGVAGFGTPIAIAAPLLISMGVPTVAAVALPLVGYHWSVTFGSMGSSFYMGGLTAQLSDVELGRYADRTALVLAVELVLAGFLVCFMHSGRQGLRNGFRTVLTVGPVMATALIVTTRIEPSLGSLAAGAAGLFTVGLLHVRHRAGAQVQERSGASAALVTRAPRSMTTERPDAKGEPFARAALVFAPYIALLIIVLVVLVPSASRSFVKEHLLVGPSFGSTLTDLGHANPAVDGYTSIALLGHPGSYILLAVAVGFLTFKSAHVWPAGSMAPMLRDWLQQVRRSSLSVIALPIVATIMVDAGMVRTIAEGTASVTGAAFPAVSPLIGLVGSFTTGSTTTSNALFAALQRDVAGLIDVPPSTLVSAQTIGGNIGNSLAPVVILVGATAIDATNLLGEIFRRVLPVAAGLAAFAAVTTALPLWVGG